MNNFQIEYGHTASGEVREVVNLRISDARKREEIIMGHFLKFYTREYGFQEELKQIGRDNVPEGLPYDFTFEDKRERRYYFELTDANTSLQRYLAEKLMLKLEVELDKSPSDNSVLIFLPNKVKLSSVSLPPIRSLPFAKSKNNDWLRSQMNKTISSDIPRYFRLPDRSKRLHLHYKGEVPSVLEYIGEAIQKKIDKKYPHQSGLTLIIDEKSIYRPSEIKAATPELIKMHQLAPFHEIFIYKGAYSDMDGTNADFNIYPIKSWRDKNISKYI